MDEAPYSAPIIVGGRPRSGTSFLRTLLNRHEEIYLSREFRQNLWETMQPLFPLVRNTYRREEFREVAPSLACARLMRALWSYAEPEGLAARRFGNKTPGSEWRVPFYEEVFTDNPPLYVFAMRHPLAQFRSVHRTDWGRDTAIADLRARWLSSARRIDRLSRELPGRVHVMQVDRAGDEATRRRAVEDLFEFVGENVTEDVAGFVARWPMINAMAEDSGPGFSRSELAAVLDDELVEAMSRHGYDPDEDAAA